MGDPPAFEPGADTDNTLSPWSSLEEGGTVNNKL